MDLSIPIWKPSDNRVNSSALNHFSSLMVQKGFIKQASYPDLYEWSVKHPIQFWGELSQFVDIKFDKKPSAIMTPEDGEGGFFGTKWFAGAELNYARNLLKERKSNDLCLISVNETRGLDRPKYVSYGELTAAVMSFSSHLKQIGVQKGDRVAALVSNSHEAVIAMLATTALGAIWSSCSPDFGDGAILERFQQIEPKALISVDGYVYSGKYFDCKNKIEKCLKELPSVKELILIRQSNRHSKIESIESGDVSVTDYDGILERRVEISQSDFPSMSFDHPLFILFSSGTTGRPKCITHGTGGTLIQHLKELVLHTDLKPGDRFFYYTTCGWMMWNWLVSGLATGAVPVLYDGNPMVPAVDQIWRFISDHKINIFGTSPKYLSACAQANIKPSLEFDLSSLKSLISTGAPLLDEQYDWVYENVKSDLHLASISGGTDIISCFMLGAPTLPVYRGQIQTIGLGMAVECWDPTENPNSSSRSSVGCKGELVCIRPFPSQPVCFWGDDDKNSKYKDAYFNFYQDTEVWRHGDFIELTPEGGVKVFGRSDATLNYGGIRIGTAEIYRQLELISSLQDSIVVERDIGDATGIALFVILAKDCVWSEALASEIKSHLKTTLSPRHVPRFIFPVQEIPYTRSGKKSEIAVKESFNQRKVVNLSSLVNPKCLEEYRQLGVFSN